MKKHFIIGLFALLSFHLNAQNMNTPTTVVTQLFISTDQTDWSALADCFADEVQLDYSSMNGQTATTLAPEAIISAWKGILPGFDHTHHQIGNWISKEESEKAAIFCYGTATHYLEDVGGNVWTVVGSYDFELTLNEQKQWKISSMKFNYKYQDGNLTLPQKAIERVKNK